MENENETTSTLTTVKNGAQTVILVAVAATAVTGIVRLAWDWADYLNDKRKNKNQK